MDPLQISQPVLLQKLLRQPGPGNGGLSTVQVKFEWGSLLLGDLEDRA